jgi:hypothetical protein
MIMQIASQSTIYGITTAIKNAPPKIMVIQRPLKMYNRNYINIFLKFNLRKKGYL